jgi:uncharacterized protein
MPLTRRIPPSVARKLGWYVYLYVNPLDGKVFYVGKGKGGRAFAHLDARAKKATSKIIRQIHAAGREPDIEILAHRLPNSETALRVEAAVIDALGLDALANRVRGWRGIELGRRPIDEAVAMYTGKKAEIREPAILIRINDLYRYGMSPVELYDATRSAWVTGPRREDAQYAFAVFEGVVREVYRIAGWLRGGKTFNARYDGRQQRRPGRWEFVGTVAEESIRKRYVNRYVGYLFSRGAQNPITYVNVD